MSLDASRLTVNRKDKVLANNTQRLANDAASSSLLLRGVVEEVVYDPVKFEVKNFEERVESPKLLQTLPVNSLLVRLTSNNSYKSNNKLSICYPLLSSHIMMPVKPGEQVWVISDNSDVSYWLSRIPGDRISEDTNFAHVDRKFLSPTKLNTKQKSSQSSDTNKIKIALSNDGSETEDSKSFKEGDGYFEIISKSTTNNFRQEPVARFKKRPGDLVLQGSNNTLICLGENRGWVGEYGAESNSNVIPKENSGTIDLVVGRGYKDDITETNENSKGQAPKQTGPRKIINDLGKIESDKNPDANNLEDSPIEGDPDFFLDASRIYLSMKTDPDAGFNVLDSLNTPFEGEFIEYSEEPAIALKTNHIRIIARSSDEEEGSIRILKQGSDLSPSCYLNLENDGKIHLSGDKIFLGNGTSTTGEGPGSSEPYLLHSQVKSLFDNILNALNGFATAVIPNTSPGFGAPNPQLTSAATQLATEINSFRSRLERLKSDRIFGE